MSNSLRILRCFALSLALIPAAVPADEGAVPASRVRYAAVLDAGSSGTRIHVYRWRPAEPLPWVEEAWNVKVEPGLSAFVGDREGLVQHLSPLVEFALDRISGEAGSESLAEAPVLLLEATGGVRALAPQARRELLASAREILEATPFRIGGIAAIDGRTEALFGWITVNYLLGRLETAAESVGALDLGGVSTQITFEPGEPPRAEGLNLALGGRHWALYSHSYEGLGQDEARLAAAVPACFPAGYPIPSGGVGAGDYASCRQRVLEWLAAPCAESPCSSMGVYQPAVEGELYAFSAFYYAASFFGLEDSFSLERLEEAGNDYCARDWSELEATYRDRLAWDAYVPRHCFTAAYVVALLHDGYGLPMAGDRVRPVDRLEGQDVGWTLGSLVFELAGGGVD